MKQRLLKMSLAALIIGCTMNAAQAQWSLNGNAGTGTSFLGTTNNFSLRMYTNNTQRMIVDSLGRVGIGTATPINILTVKGAGSKPAASWVSAGAPLFTGFGEQTTGNADYILSMASTLANARPVFIGRRSKGTLAAPAITANNDFLMSFLASGYDGAAFQNPASIDFYVDGTPAAGNVPARISFVTGSNSTNRAERLKIGNTGDITMNTNQFFLQRSSGNVGIGTITPTAKLDIVGNIKIVNGSQAAGRVLTSDANGMASWTTPGATPWTVSGNNISNSNSGNVGIGTSAPTSKLDVRGNGLDDGGVLNLGNSDNSNQMILFGGRQNDPNPLFLVTANTPFRFSSLRNGYTELMRIDSIGRMGLGTSTPIAPLEVVADNSFGGMSILNNTSPDGFSGQYFKKGNQLLGYIGYPSGNGWINPNTFQLASTLGNMVFSVNKNGSHTERMRIDTNGNVGIGTNTPADKLTVQTATNSYGLTHTDGTITLGSFVGNGAVGGQFGTKSNHPLGFFTNGSSPQMTLLTNGNVGIGTSSPTAKLDVTGNVKITDGTQGAGKVLTSDASGMASWQTSGASSWAVSGNNISNSNTGGVGIGTNTPSYGLHVNNDADVWHAGFGGATGLLRIGAQTVQGAIIQSWNPATNLPRDLYLQRDGGRVSIGTATLPTGSDLHVKAISGNCDVSLFPATGKGWNFAGTTLSDLIIASFDGTTYNDKLIIKENGNVGIGTTTPSAAYKLTVAGKIICTELKVQVQPFPDYVFAANYKLPSLKEVESHINTYHRLPGMPSATEVEADGMEVGKMQTKVVEKVEEATLYILQLSKENEALKNQLTEQGKAIAELQAALKNLQK